MNFVKLEYEVFNPNGEKKLEKLKKSHKELRNLLEAQKSVLSPIQSIQSKIVQKKARKKAAIKYLHR